MKHTFNVTVSQHDADVTLRRFLFRGAGWGLLFAVLFCIAYVIHDGLNGGIGALGIVIITVLFLLVTTYVAAFAIRRKQTAELLKRLDGSPISYQLDDSELSATSALGSSILKWEMIQKLWIDPDLTMVFYTWNGYTTIPTSQIPAEALDFLVGQVEGAGGSVVDNKTART
ncbi:YcxB family protein [Verrucomicrobiales bacterium]|nr:YcxB family protein [Verrucomicrobiales bacterium]